jgi:hypothetical protein
LIIDQRGVRTNDLLGAAAVFGLISARYEGAGSMILTPQQAICQVS